MTIKAIETQYKGYRFRSRLEARWAVFFDVLGIQWEYEPEGFDLTDAYLDHLIQDYEVQLQWYNEGIRDRPPEEPEVDTSLSMWYLPDFYLRGLDEWVEIKPYKDCQPWMDDIRHQIFPKPLIVLFGLPGAVSTDQYYDSPPYAGAINCDSPYYLCECPDCGALGFQFDGRSARNKHLPSCAAMTGDKGYNADSPRIIAAEKAARSARFEHGESPITA